MAKQTDENEKAVKEKRVKELRYLRNERNEMMKVEKMEQLDGYVSNDQKKNRTRGNMEEKTNRNVTGGILQEERREMIDYREKGKQRS